MRFVKKFVNGYWVVFDTVSYTNVERCRSLREVEERLAPQPKQGKPA